MPHPTDERFEADQNRRRQRGRSTITWVLLTLTFIAVLALPTLIVFFFGMLPSLVAYIIDRSKQKSAAFTVSAINFIGVFPYIMDLWTKNYTTDKIDVALGMVSDIFTLLVMYSAAAFGWLIYLALPSIISSFVIVLQQRKVAQLRGEQKDLIDEWGADVAALVEMQKMEKQEHHLEHSMERGHQD